MQFKDWLFGADTALMRDMSILHYLFYGYGLFWMMVGLRDGQPTLISTMGIGFVAIGVLLHLRTRRMQQK
jgi:hypothetical protein